MRLHVNQCESYTPPQTGRCNSTRTLEWERVFVRGRRPSRRYGHSMVPLTAPSRTCGYAKLLLFGGTSGKGCSLITATLAVSLA